MRLGGWGVSRWGEGEEFQSVVTAVDGAGVCAVGWGWGSLSSDEAWAGCEEFGGSAMRRRGRKRKAGHRTRSGRLVHDPRLRSNGDCCDDAAPACVRGEGG